MVTSKRITAEERHKLSNDVTTIMEKADLDWDRFLSEVRRAMSGRPLVA